MTEDPCQTLFDAFTKATVEWGEAAEAAQAFRVVKPLDPNQDIEPMPRERFEEMAAAYRREEAARKRYFDAYRAYDECRRDLGV